MFSHLSARFRAFLSLEDAFGWTIIGLASAACFVFVRLTREMVEGETHDFDNAVIRGLRQAADPALPIGPHWLTKIFTDLTALGGTTVLTLMFVLVVGFLLLRRSHREAIFVTVAILGGWLLSTLLKLGVARPRPDLVPHLVEVYDFSFPSGHAMLSAVTYLTLGALLAGFEKRRTLRAYYFAVAIALTLMIGFSRVYLGVHYPTDVLGGWCAGMAWASLCWCIARQMARRRQLRFEGSGDVRPER